MGSTSMIYYWIYQITCSLEQGNARELEFEHGCHDFCWDKDYTSVNTEVIGYNVYGTLPLRKRNCIRAKPRHEIQYCTDHLSV
ncbi:hypothetical protein SADUNF_Sadunf13G0020000 [Salix dunnii]|uniref:Uncharacterized protein n=1 Tax=Salix dunnii TaxID=1413687 RepID=A0A835JID4_9ROSI|nr:hypothetical protein SADUNF_Sadunf13G0020000 [Salix dunnii]